MAKVLIAEDDPITSRLILTVVERLGHSAFRCSNGRRALECLIDNPDIGLLITDLGMPEISGSELANLLRGQECYPRLPILVCSATVDHSLLPYLQGLGISGYFPKPIDFKQLGAAIQEVIGSQVGEPSRRTARRGIADSRTAAPGSQA